MKNNRLKGGIKTKKKRVFPALNGGKHFLSPIKFTITFLIVWVLGIFLGVGINLVIERYINFNTISQYVFLVLAFVLASAIMAMPIAFLITKALTKITNYINENIDKVGEGDFSVELKHITKNPQINNTIDNFNKMVKQLNSVSILNSDFIAGFSHEFKTPIVSIKGYAELLNDSNNLIEEEKEYVKIIIEESVRLSKLSKKVMLLAKLDSQVLPSNTEVFSLDGQIENCVLLLDNKLKEKNVDLILNLEKISIKSDPDLVKEIWINLLSNSVKFVRENGKISISLRRGEKADAIVEIKDDGIGMNNITKSHIFEKFYQGDTSHSSKGLGLGLSIVSKIVEIIGGEIKCESEENKGTTMTVILKL